MDKTGKTKRDPKRNAKNQADLKARREAQGLVRCTVWARPEHHAAIKAYAAEITSAQLQPHGA